MNDEQITLTKAVVDSYYDENITIKWRKEIESKEELKFIKFK